MAWCISSFAGRKCSDRHRGVVGRQPDLPGMQKALKYQVYPDHLQGLQLDIGAPPQFMDFLYVVHDRWHGSSAWTTAAPARRGTMGEDYVRGMCHDIGTPRSTPRLATNAPRCGPFTARPHAVGPAPALRLDGRHRRLPSRGQGLPPLAVIEDHCRRLGAGPHRSGSRRGPVRLPPAHWSATSTSPPSRTRPSFASPKRCACRCTCSACPSCWPSSARHRRSAGSRYLHQQLIGLAGIAAERIHKALKLPAGVDGVLRTMELHPLFSPAGYVDAGFADGWVQVHRSPATTTGPGSRCAHPSRPSRCKPLRPRSTRLSKCTWTAPRTRTGRSNSVRRRPDPGNPGSRWSGSPADRPSRSKSANPAAVDRRVEHLTLRSGEPIELRAHPTGTQVARPSANRRTTMSNYGPFRIPIRTTSTGWSGAGEGLRRPRRAVPAVGEPGGLVGVVRPGCRAGAVEPETTGETGDGVPGHLHRRRRGAPRPSTGLRHRDRGCAARHKNNNRPPQGSVPALRHRRNRADEADTEFDAES